MRLKKFFTLKIFAILSVPWGAGIARVCALMRSDAIMSFLEDILDSWQSGPGTDWAHGKARRWARPEPEASCQLLLSSASQRALEASKCQKQQCVSEKYWDEELVPISQLRHHWLGPARPLTIPSPRLPRPGLDPGSSRHWERRQDNRSVSWQLESSDGPRLTFFISFWFKIETLRINPKNYQLRNFPQFREACIIQSNVWCL